MTDDVSRPPLGDLDALLVVARTGSLGAAAAELGTTQPSLSRRMDSLERLLGVRLLRRSRQGSVLTAEGEAVAGWAGRVLGAADEFGRSVVALSNRGAVGLRLGVSMTVAEHYAPDWLGRLRARRPDVEPRLAIGNSTEVASWVRSRHVELGIVETPALPGDLRRRRVGTDELVVAAPPGHAWATRPPTVDELAATPLLLREPGSGTRDTIERALAAHGHPPNVGMVLSSNAALRASAVAGLGPVVLSRRAIAAEVASGHLVEVDVDGLELRRALTALVRRDARLGVVAEELLEAIDA